MPVAQTKSISFFLGKIEEELIAVDTPSKPENLYNPVKYALSKGGKRIRPLLVLLGCEWFGKSWEKAIKPALAVEMLHNFTLVHDDVMDDAPLRRKQATVFKKYGSNAALLSGDVMLVKAYKLVSQCPEKNLKKILDTFSYMALKVCEGQQMDMDFETSNSVSVQDYLQMIRLKTAEMLAGSLKLGALCAGAEDVQSETIYEAGINLGIAFQLMDDYLDAFGNPEKFGKQKGGDIIANKKTFLYLKSLQLASPKQKEELELLFSNSKNFAGKIEKTLSFYSELNIEKESMLLIRTYHQKANELLDSLNGNNETKEILNSLAEKLLSREQ
jgi:geranylgeranyl diphosphate synthase, type II